jgi:hypothetical protein
MLSDESFPTYRRTVVPSPLGSNNPRGISLTPLIPEDEGMVILQNIMKYPCVDTASYS